MSKVMGLVLACMFIFGPAAAVHAQGESSTAEGKMNMEKGGMMGSGMMGRAMMHKEMMGMKMHHMHEMMQRMQKNVFPTSDGGVIVVWGNQMTKYNSDLNVVKEVTLPGEDPQKMMKEMMEKCPMMGKAMPGAAKGQADDSADKAEGAADGADHAGHH